MSYLFDGNDQFYCATSGLISAVPLTLVCWFKIAAAPGASENILAVGESGGTNNFFKLGINTSSQAQAISDVSGTTDINPLTTVTVSNDTWSMAAAIFASNASRRAYLNGTLDSDDNTSIATPWTAIDRFVIGGSATFASDFNGYIAHVQVYGRALNETELDILYGGTNPLAASTNSDLVGYWPLTTDTSASEGNALSTNGSPVLYASDNPTVDATTTKYLKVLLNSGAQSDTGVVGVVFEEPAGSDITGAKVGEFTGAAFEADLEDGKAVLLVALSEFDGSALTTSDTPVAYVKTATDHSPIVSCTVVEV